MGAWGSPLSQGPVTLLSRVPPPAPPRTAPLPGYGLTSTLSHAVPGEAAVACSAGREDPAFPGADLHTALQLSGPARPASACDWFLLWPLGEGFTQLSLASIPVFGSLA